MCACTCTALLQALSSKYLNMSQTDTAYGQLKEKIIAGEFHPGDQIDASTLSEDLGLGRTPVREALLRLQAEGILEIIPKRGVRIVPLSAEDLMDIYQVISLIEIEALRLICETQPDDGELAPLSSAVKHMAITAKSNDREEWALADECFHRQILELCPNRRLHRVGLAHRDLAQRSHFVALRLLTPAQRIASSEQHKKLLELIQARDTGAAVKNHHKQRNRGAKILIDILREHRLTRL